MALSHSSRAPGRAVVLAELPADEIVAVEELFVARAWRVLTHEHVRAARLYVEPHGQPASEDMAAFERRTRHWSPASAAR